VRLLRRYVRFGTERYPEKTARRLRALNLTTAIAAVASSGFAVVQFFDSTPGIWEAAAVNALAAPVLAGIPLLHRFGELVGAMVFILTAYAYFFVLIILSGTANGMQFYYLAGAAFGLLYLGNQRFILACALAGLAATSIIALQRFVPQNTGLQSDATQFGNFITTVVVCCASLLIIVRYVLGELGNAEAAAEREYQRSELLLGNILPAPIAERLKSRAEAVIADQFDQASVLFADMAGFTARSSDTPPAELVTFLNSVFSNLDRLVERHSLEKIKTTGDAYMVVAGVPEQRADHASALAHLAIDMRDLLAGLVDPKGREVPIRIGIATGPVVAGVVGTRKFFYDVWGDTVNVASRMESTGEAGKIQVTDLVREQLAADFDLEPRGVIDVRGKGQLHTWFLVGRKSARQPVAL
jgi:adenylate cyclase